MFFAYNPVNQVKEPRVHHCYKVLSSEEIESLKVGDRIWVLDINGKDALAYVRVEISRAIAYAKVFVSSALDKTKNKKAVYALNNAAGFIQKCLSKKMKTRNTPKLTFIFDESFEEGFRINKIIEDNIT